MRYALIADIHANLPALDAVLTDVAAKAPDQVYHLGDLVGYAPWPNECVERVREAGFPGISGNYDSAIATGFEPKHADEASRLTYEWTAKETSARARDFLQALPFRLDIRPEGGHTPGRTVVLVHATPLSNTTAWWSHLPDSFHLEMAAICHAQRGDVIACGHIHRPWYREIEGIHFVSVGSVGRPKDGDPRSCYVVLNMEGDQVDVEFVRVDYDLEAAARGILESPLPNEYADFLRTGGATT